MGRTMGRPLGYRQDSDGGRSRQVKDGGRGLSSRRVGKAWQGGGKCSNGRKECSRGAQGVTVL